MFGKRPRLLRRERGQSRGMPNGGTGSRGRRSRRRCEKRGIQRLWAFRKGAALVRKKPRTRQKAREWVVP